MYLRLVSAATAQELPLTAKGSSTVSSERARRITLTAEEFRALFKVLRDRERALGIVCATTGLRISEGLGLKWEDIDFVDKSMNVLRSYVDGAVGPCKSETSQQPVPLDEIAVEGLLTWRSICAYGADEDWAFASETLFGNVRCGRTASELSSSSPRVYRHIL